MTPASIYAEVGSGLGVVMMCSYSARAAACRSSRSAQMSIRGPFSTVSRGIDRCSSAGRLRRLCRCERGDQTPVHPEITAAHEPGCRAGQELDYVGDIGRTTGQL